ncbi:MAG: hypothetical protein HC901_02275 [Bdellovibrionaceae bacterium]|nr:hypothetical protein [Pseudobdellovibrionaceae bacterium]
MPLIIRYPALVKGGSASSSMVQSTDLVPTFFDLAGATVPEAYVLDGKSLRPVLADPAAEIHDSLYIELGSARAVVKDGWKYIAVRYPEERVEKIKKAGGGVRMLGYMNYLSRAGGIATRGLEHSIEFLSPDQLYHLAADPEEKKNLAEDAAHAGKLAEMRAVLTERLQGLGRPFGEFVAGPGAVPGGPGCGDRAGQSAGRRGGGAREKGKGKKQMKQ